MRHGGIEQVSQMRARCEPGATSPPGRWSNLGVVSDLELWHNPRCSKSRRALELLEETGTPFRVRPYLTEPPTPELLDSVLVALGAEPWELVRSHEPSFAELDVDAWAHERSTWLRGLTEHPVLIERPILISADGQCAIVARPPELVLDFVARHDAKRDWLSFDSTLGSFELRAMKL